MSICKKISILALLNFITVATVLCQFKFDKAVLFNKENGLPTNEIVAIRKGKDGFMWVGTGAGLCRFDGQQVKTFQEGKDLRYSLFDNTVIAVLPVGNHIWIGTNQGLSILNTINNTFKHYQFTDNGKATDSLKRKYDQSVPVLYKDRFGKIWIGTRNRGVCVYDEAKDDFRFFSFSRKDYPRLVPSLGPDNAILSIEASQTNDSIIWAGTPAGLQEINKYTGTVKLFTYPDKSKDYQVALNAFRRLRHHDDGLLYVGSWGASVNVFDPLKKTFTPLVVKNEEGKKILNAVIGNVFRKSSHELWITTGLGLAVYDTDLQEITWQKLNTAAINEFYAIDYIDEANRVWYGDINGLQYFDPAMQQFASYSLSQFTGSDWGYLFYIWPDKSGNNITVCPRMTDGLYHFDKLKKTWHKSVFPQNKKFKSENDVIRGFVQLASGDYIISSYKGVFQYSEKKNQITSLTAKLPATSARWGEILQDSKGNLWISADAIGLIKWNLLTSQYKIYGNESLETDTTGSFRRLANLFEDSHGNIWFERWGGFGVYLEAKDSIVNFIYAENEANSFPRAQSFAEDKNGKVWISGGDGWLGYAMSNDPGNGVVYKINARKGFSYYYPHLATDNNGDIWGYTSEELIKINAADLSLSRYSFQYGVKEPDFYHFSFLPSGEMIFGGRNDITIANPSELKRNTEIPVPYISEMQVLNQPFNFINDGTPLHLKHKQNFFSIGFSAQAYTMPKDVRFRYRLYNFDEWTEVAGRRFANYTNVPGGDYVFQLQAANNEGVWNEKTLELPVHIATAFWQTWWFRIAAILAISLAAYSFYRYRIGQIRKKQKLKSEYEKKLANVEMSALLAQMNPHFLFNSLNSIDSYIIRNESKQASEYLNNFARLMRLILQNSRSNYISLKDELEALDLYLQMESLRFKNKFNYSITVDDTIDTSSIVIPPMLIQPYVENAIWHGLMHKSNGEEGKVEIQLSKKEENLLCVVNDNGIGRKKAAELKAQKHNNHKRSMGMQITQDRIEIINKLYDINASVQIYDLENELGEAKGTKVELIIPV